MTTLHQPARKFINNDDLALHHHIFAIALIEVVGLQGVIQKVGPVHVSERVEALHTGQFFSLAHTVFGHVAGAFFFFDLKVNVLLQQAGHAVGFHIACDVVLSRT